jgi:hypothetical protein
MPSATPQQRTLRETAHRINKSMSTEEKKALAGKTQRQPQRIRLPGFIKEEEIGLGDVIKKVTYAMGIKQDMVAAVTPSGGGSLVIE